MFEGLLGQMVNGMVWGAGAGLALSATRGGAGGLRPVAKALVKAGVVVSDRVQEMTAEARETMDDLYAEIRAEQQAQADAEETVQARPARSRARRNRAGA